MESERIPARLEGDQVNVCTLHKLMAILTDETVHFLLACGAGFLGFYGTSIILSMVSKLVFRSGTPSGINRLILIISLCVAFGLVLLSHCWLDGLVQWYTTPLNTPLRIETH